MKGKFLCEKWVMLFRLRENFIIFFGAITYYDDGVGAAPPFYQILKAALLTAYRIYLILFCHLPSYLIKFHTLIIQSILQKVVY